MPPCRNLKKVGKDKSSSAWEGKMGEEKSAGWGEGGRGIRTQILSQVKQRERWGVFKADCRRDFCGKAAC